MASLGTTTFGVTAGDPFGLNGAIGGVSFAFVGYSETRGKTLVFADKENGEYTSGTQAAIDSRVSISATYRAQTDNGTVTGATLQLFFTHESTARVIALDSVVVDCSKGDFAQVTINAHRHEGGSNSNQHNANAATVPLPNFHSFGCSAFGVDVNVNEAALQSSTYTLRVTHKDETNSGGNFLCGSSFGVTASVSLEAIDSYDWGDPDGWIATSRDAQPRQSNTTHQSRQVTFERHLVKNNAGTAYA